MLPLLLACATPVDDTGAAPTFHPPDAPGPWAAGTFDVVADTSGGELHLQVWYPAASGADEDTVRYDDLIQGDALDEPPADCAQPRPVMVFSHGNGGMRFQSIFWTEFLATHGWVVVAPDHPENTVYDLDESILLDVAMRRPLEVAASFDWLVDTSGDGALAGCLDASAGYAVSGHSFGGYTTVVVTGTVIDLAASAAWCADHPEWLCDDAAEWAAAHPDEPVVDHADPRVTAGVAMTPAGYELLVGGLGANDTPLLVWGGGRDYLTPVDSQVRPIWADLANAGNPLATLTDAGHYTFSDACGIAPVFDDCGEPYLSPEAAHPTIRTASLAFLQVQAGWADAAAWLPPEDPQLVWELPAGD
jgi:predicted dienelactone hydrolase